MTNVHHVVHIDDLELARVVVAPASLYLSGRARDTEPQGVKFNDLGVYYQYPSLHDDDGYYDTLRVQVDDGRWFAPSYYSGSEWQTMASSDGETVIDMGINPLEKSKEVHEKVEMTLANPSERVVALCEHIERCFTEAVAKYNLVLKGKFNNPLRQKDKFLSLKARIAIVLANKKTKVHVKRPEMTDAVKSGEARWYPKETVVFIDNAETGEREQLGVNDDIFVALADGLTGSAVLYFPPLVVYSGVNVSCGVNVLTLAGVPGNVRAPREVTEPTLFPIKARERTADTASEPAAKKKRMDQPPQTGGFGFGAAGF